MNMPCEHCLSRRDFLATAVGAAGLAVVVGCGDGVISNPSTQIALPAGPVTITVADFPGLATVGVLVKIPQTEVAVKRVDASTFKAISMVCTHQGCVINTNGQTFECPCHFSRFDNDGAVVNGPNTGGSIAPLDLFDTSYDPATDQLTIS
jgi:cytochrome b6-f complex iron-sulfur subunit